KWEIDRNNKRVLFILMFIVLAGIGFVVLEEQPSSSKRQPAPGPKPYQTEAPTRGAPASSKPGYIRPAAAPNGTPWPAGAAYVNGYPIDHNDGHSNVTVDNTRNDADVFVKLVSLDGASAYPV